MKQRHDWLPTAIMSAIFFLLGLGLLALSGCAGFATFVDLVDPRLAACEQYKERPARMDCIEGVVDGVEEALELAREVREQSR